MILFLVNLTTLNSFFSGLSHTEYQVQEVCCPIIQLIFHDCFSPQKKVEPRIIAGSVHTYTGYTLSKMHI